MPADEMDEMTKLLYSTTDASVWAKHWVETAREIVAREGSTEALFDEGWMIGWFANAMSIAEIHKRPVDPWDPVFEWVPPLFQPVPVPESYGGDPESMIEVQDAINAEMERRSIHPFADLFRFQDAVAEWSSRNFGDGLGNGTGSMMGLSEEQGELAEALLESMAFISIVATLGRLTHAHLKGEQGIRYTSEEIQAKKKDAVGDLLVYLADYCKRAHLLMGDCVGDAWREVRRRDWVANPTDAAQKARDAAQ